jgi:hypothetical protein
VHLRSEALDVADGRDEAAEPESSRHGVGAMNRRTFLASLGAIVALPKVTSANPPVAESWSPPPIEFTALAGEPIVQGDLVVWTERFAGHEIVRRVTCSEEFSVACQRSRAGVAITTATAWAKVLIRTQGQMLVRVEGSVLR